MAKARYYGNLNRLAQDRELDDAGKPSRGTKILVYDENGSWCGKLAVTPATIAKIRSGDLQPLSSFPSKRGKTERRTFDVTELSNANDPYHSLWVESEKIMAEKEVQAGT